MRTPRAVLVASVLSLLASAREAGAGSNEAESLFERGLKDMEAGLYEQACPPIEQSYQLEPLPGTLFTLAECEARRGRIATAVKRYDEYLDVHAKLSRGKRAKQGERPNIARRQKQLLEPEIPRLSLVLPSDASPEIVIQCDGEPVSKTSLDAPLLLDPGEHVVTAWVPGEALSQHRVKLSRGEKLTLRLKQPSKSTKAPPAPPVAASAPVKPDDPGVSPSPGRRVGTYVAGGVGLVGLVVGGLMGGFAIAEKSTVDARCTTQVDDATRGCDAEGWQASRKLKTFGLWSTVAFAAGAVGGGVALVLVVTEPKEGESQQARVPSTSAGVLSAGPDGGVIGVQGTW